MNENVLGSRKLKAALTKEKIYKSAEYLFDKNGFDIVSVDDIVEHAGVSKGSFYVHFESKDELIAILIDDHVKKADIDYRAYLNTLPQTISVDEVFLALIGKIADVITDVIGHENMKNLYKAHLTHDVRTQALIDYNRDLYIIFSDIISKGMEQNIFKSDLSVEEISIHFVTAYRGLTFEWCMRYPDFNLKSQALSQFKLFLSGIKSSSD